jgi:hypothetical protein
MPLIKCLSQADLSKAQLLSSVNRLDKHTSHFTLLGLP